MALDSPRSGNPNRERGVYLGERIKVLQAEIKSLRDEKKTIVATLKAMSDMKSPEAKQLKMRRVYVSRRPDDAKAELSQLITERRSLVDSLKNSD